MVVKRDWSTHRDQGCADAKRFFGYEGKCTSCPIKPDCLEVLKDKHKNLENYFRHMAILKLLKKGETTVAIISKLGVNRKIVKCVRDKYLGGKRYKKGVNKYDENNFKETTISYIGGTG